MSRVANPNQRLQEKIVSAAELGNIDEVRAAVQSFSDSVEKSYRDKMHSLGIALDYILERLGEDAVAEVWRRKFDDLKLPDGMAAIGHDANKLIVGQDVVKSWNCSPVSDASYGVEETQEVVSYDYTSCPSGGLYRRGGMGGASDKTKWTGRPWKTLKGKRSYTFGLEGVHPYCVHCGVLNDIYKEKGLLIEFEYGKDPPNHPCKFVIHKKQS